MNILNPGSGSSSKEDNKRIIIAVVLITIVMGVGLTVQNALFPTPPPAPATSTTLGADTGAGAGSAGSASAAAVPGAAASSVSATPALAASPSPPAAAETYSVETDLFQVTLTNRGGDIVSLALKKHKDKNGNVELIVPNAAGSQGLSLAFGDALTAPVQDLMAAQLRNDTVQVNGTSRTQTLVEFSRTFYAQVPGEATPVPFVYKKTYSFRDGEYMFGLAVTLENSRNTYLPLDEKGVAYTISLGPQIGPRFDQLPKNADFRKYITEVGGKKKNEMPKEGLPFVPKTQASWAAISGKYFAFIAIPDKAAASFSFLTTANPEIRQTNSMSLVRPAIKASAQTDTYYFYFGPKTAAELSRYEYADKNSFGLSGMRLEDAMERSNILGWLETILKFLLNIFYKIIPNYGVAIILVTIFTKIIMFPLTKKGSISSARMQELQPQIAELQAKYKGNPQKLNQEMAEFYKREQYNPMSGCLPMLIQMPLFFAMYSLFNNHFDLRGAMFIPGWIPDLSLPESVLSFGDFRLPILNWSDLRLLPIIYLGSQLLYGKFTQASTQAAGSQSAGQMKMMMYGMPIMFFFILYDVPSGLLVYWIASNVATILQQLIINNMLKKNKLKLHADDEQSGGTSARVQMRNAGKTTVRSASGAKGAAAKGGATGASGGRSKSGDTRDFGEKTRDWLEKKAAEAEAATKARQNADKASDKNAGGKTNKKRGAKER